MSDKNIKMHHVKFYRPEVRSILCIHLQRESQQLALSRSDNSVEIWNVSYKPVLIKCIPGVNNITVEDIKWCGNRLLSCGLQGSVVEYDLVNESVKDSTSVTGGAAWCLDFCKNTNLVAVGTEEGFINIFTVTSEGLEFFKFLDKQQGRILCMCWDQTGKFLITGSIDVVRVWNLDNGHAIHKMTLERLEKKRDTVVWSVAVTKELMIISGDSRGCVTFWDGKVGAQVQSFHSHDADVLTVALSENESTVYCAGVDPIIALFGRVVERSGELKQWARGGVRSIHDHDVRAMAAADNGGLFSGGVDGYLAYSKYPPKLRLKCPPFLKGPCVQIIKSTKMVLLRYHGHLELWKLGEAVSGAEKDQSPLPLASSPVCLLRLAAPDSLPIVCAGVSEDARFIAYSTDTSLRLFHFNLEETTLTKLNGPDELDACKLLAFYTSGQKQLCAATSRCNEIHILQLSDHGVEEIHTFRPSQVSSLSDSILHTVVSPSGKLLIVADSSSHICVWDTSNWNLVATLPTYKAVPTAVAVSYDSSNLFVTYADFKLVEYSMKSKKYSEFTAAIQNNLCNNLSSVIRGITLDPRNDNGFVVYDDSNICAVSKTKGGRIKSPPKKSKQINEVEIHRDDNEGPECNVISNHQHIAAVEFLLSNEVVLVETSPLSFLEHLPPTLAKKKYGT